MLNIVPFGAAVLKKNFKKRLSPLSGAIHDPRDFFWTNFQVWRTLRHTISSHGDRSGELKTKSVQSEELVFWQGKISQ